MIKKIIIGATLSLFAVCASAASLTLINNELHPIQVNCNGITGLPIPAEQGGDGGKITLPYFLIAAKFGSRDVKCTFTDGTGAQGNAELAIRRTFLSAQITSYSPQTGGVVIDPTLALIQPVSDITVTLNQL